MNIALDLLALANSKKKEAGTAEIAAVLTREIAVPNTENAQKLGEFVVSAATTAALPAQDTKALEALPGTLDKLKLTRKMLPADVAILSEAKPALDKLESHFQAQLPENYAPNPSVDTPEQRIHNSMALAKFAAGRIDTIIQQASQKGPHWKR